MEEIFRYQQLRQPQTLSGEQKLAAGLPLYPGQTLSDFASKLSAATGEKNAYTALLERFKKENGGALLIRDLNDLHPVVRACYNWLNFKARPIKKEDLKQFVDSLEEAVELDIYKEWLRYADNFVVALYDQQLSFNYCIDFRLLIRICYLFRLCLSDSNGKLSVKENYSPNLLNAILELPILLPPRILWSRCTEDCSSKGKIALPDAPERIVVNDKDPCKCTCNESCQQPSHHCICIKPYIADLFIIKETLARYEEGDIADIENILAGEKKIRKHRNLYRTEDSTEKENETLSSEERDNQVNEKFSLQSEVRKTLEARVGLDAGVTANLKYGETTTVTPHANVTASFAKTQAENMARSYAKELIDRSVTKIQEKVRSLQLSKIINEFEEKNSHSIDNTAAGSGHRAGIYYWVNKITHAQVFNYGKHMMFDLIVPEPAATYKKLYELKNQHDNAHVRPVKPNVQISQITRTTYGMLLSQYGLAGAIEPPAEQIALQLAIHQNLSEPEDEITAGFSSAEFKSEPIPEGYRAEHMDYSIACYVGDPAAQTGSDEAAVSVTIGKSTLLSRVAASSTLNSVNNWSASNNNIPLNGETGVITAAVAGYASVALSISGTISIICRLTDEGYDKWRVQIYNQIMEDYNRRLAVFESTKKEEPLIQIKGRNPFLNREIERNEFKRHIISILLCNTFNGIGSMMEKTAPCGYPEINFEKLEKDSPLIQFFEQVFEWNYMSYLFYHSMWARKCKWPELIDDDSGDPLFDKFLMAGAARVQVPVRPGMEEYFSWFLKTGQLWGASGTPPVSGDDEYVSMIQELKESKQCDYTDRPGLVEATQGSDQLLLTASSFYWDFINNTVNQLNIDNDIDRELLFNYQTYRIVAIEQQTPGDPTRWAITIERNYASPSIQNQKHAVGALYVGTPWEIRIPTKLVYLRNPQDQLPVYPLT